MQRTQAGAPELIGDALFGLDQGGVDEALSENGRRSWRHDSGAWDDDGCQGGRTRQTANQNREYQFTRLSTALQVRKRPDFCPEAYVVALHERGVCAESIGRNLPWCKGEARRTLLSIGSESCVEYEEAKTRVESGIEHVHELHAAWRARVAFLAALQRRRDWAAELAGRAQRDEARLGEWRSLRAGSWEQLEYWRHSSWGELCGWRPDDHPPSDAPESVRSARRASPCTECDGHAKVEEEVNEARLRCARASDERRDARNSTSVAIAHIEQSWREHCAALRGRPRGERPGGEALQRRLRGATESVSELASLMGGQSPWWYPDGVPVPPPFALVRPYVHFETAMFDIPEAFLLRHWGPREKDFQRILLGARARLDRIGR